MRNLNNLLPNDVFHDSTDIGKLVGSGAPTKAEIGIRNDWQMIKTPSYCRNSTACL